MRLTSLLLVVAIGLSVLAPAGAVYLHAGPVTASIETLDVCHHALSVVNPDTPCVHECHCALLPLLSAGTRVAFDPTGKPVLLSYRDERPPETLF